MLPDRIAVLGPDKRLNAAIAKRIAKETGLEYMDLDGYMRYMLGGFTPYQTLLKSDADYLRRRIRSCIEDAASFEGVAISASPLIFCVGADILTASSLVFMTEGNFESVLSDKSLIMRLADRSTIYGNIKAALGASVALSCEQGYEEEIRKVLEVLIDG